MKNRKKYIIQFTLSLSGTLIFTLAKHLKIIPHSVRVPTFYSYSSYDDFFISFIGLWIVLGIFIVLINRVDSKKVSVICPSCEHSEEILKKESETKQCPSCNIKMLPLDGFYDKN